MIRKKKQAGSTVAVVTTLLRRGLLCRITRQNLCPTFWVRFQSLATINSIDIRSVAFLLRLQISHCLFTSSPIVPFQPRMYQAFFNLDHSAAILNEDDAPTRTITDPTSYLDLSPTSSESIDHVTVSSQSTLPKPFQAFFATRSRVLKVSGVCGITSLTLLT